MLLLDIDYIQREFCSSFLKSLNTIACIANKAQLFFCPFCRTLIDLHERKWNYFLPDVAFYSCNRLHISINLVFLFRVLLEQIPCFILLQKELQSGSLVQLLRYLLGWPYAILELPGIEPQRGFISSFVLTGATETAGDGSSSFVPAIHVGDPVLASTWLRSGYCQNPNHKEI